MIPGKWQSINDEKNHFVGPGLLEESENPGVGDENLTLERD
jgi:hypothetical protein